ncbi:hypothetical protein B0H11DRAFT_2373767 [Mycena galericulata]|nr:hypothetical protein B0H11DRAFT_2373767 [Mycena galericulata]
MEMAKVQTLKWEQQYPVFTLADLELQQVLNPMGLGHSRAVARLVPYQKRVLVRRYNNTTTSNFQADIERLTPLRHPNLPFLGASSLRTPAPFVVMELAFHTPVHDVIQGLYGESRRVFQRKAIEIVSGVLEAMHHLRENHISLSTLWDELSSIQYDGSKVIMNVDLPKRQPPKPDPICSAPFGLSNTELSVEESLLFLKGQAQLTSPKHLFGLSAYMDLAESYAVPSALRPIWQYWTGFVPDDEYGSASDSKRRLSDLRSINEQLWGRCDGEFDIVPALVATGNHPYLKFRRLDTDDAVALGSVVCATKSGRLVVRCNLLRELQDNGAVDMNHFTLTEVDDDYYPLEEDAAGGVSVSEILPDFVGEYESYDWASTGLDSVSIGRTTTDSLHDPAASDVRRRIQQYLHQRLPSLLQEHSWDYQLPVDGFILVGHLTGFGYPMKQ